MMNNWITEDAFVQIAYVKYDHKSYGKVRPVLIFKQDEETTYFFRITSQYEEKSDFIKHLYYPIKNYRELGLNRPSYIDLMSKTVDRTENFTMKKLGHLTHRDAWGVNNKLNQTYTQEALHRELD